MKVCTVSNSGSVEVVTSAFSLVELIFLNNLNVILLLYFIFSKGRSISFGSKTKDLEHKCSLPLTL